MNRATRICFYLQLAACFVFGQDKSASAEGSDGLCGRLEKFGISLESSYIGEFWGNIRGGHERDWTHLHKIDSAVSIDTKKFGLWDNGTLTVRMISTQGGRLFSEEIVGDSQIVSNIEAPHSTRLYELWYEHHLFKEKLSFLFGIHDLGSEFAVSENGALFINSSFGTPKHISGGGRPGIFPIAAPAARIRYIPHPDWELRFGAYSGDPGDPLEYRHFPKISFDGKSGIFINIEAARFFGPDKSAGAIKAGYWRNTGEFKDRFHVDTQGNPLPHKGNEGFYLIADANLFRDHNNRGLGAFLQFGMAPNRHLNKIQTYMGGGVKYAGLIPRRIMDEFGVALAHAHAGDSSPLDEGKAEAETALEITYRIVFHKHWALQPDVQWIVNPGASSTLKNSIAAGIRLEISY
jgi:porin